jgi:hypothetical protein
MLIASKNSTKNKMMLLIALVIAIFIIVGVYVGYHASQQVPEEAHDIDMDLEILSHNSGLVQILQNSEIKKSLL